MFKTKFTILQKTFSWNSQEELGKKMTICISAFKQQYSMYRSPKSAHKFDTGKKSNNT